MILTETHKAILEVMRQSNLKGETGISMDEITDRVIKMSEFNSKLKAELDAAEVEADE